MTRCQTCFNHEDFCTCNEVKSELPATREYEPVQIIPLEWRQKIAAAPFN